MYHLYSGRFIINKNSDKITLISPIIPSPIVLFFPSQGSTRSELPGSLLALCRQTLGSERYRYLIAWPDKRGTDRWRMEVLNEQMDAAAELGRNPVSEHQIQPEYGDEQADAGRNCRSRLARPNSQARTNAGREMLIFLVQLTTCRIGNLTRLIHTLAMCLTIHTYTTTLQMML